MGEVTIGLDVDRPVEEVFDFWARPEAHVEWQEALVEATPLTKGPVGLGTRFRIVRELGGTTHHAVFEISAFDRPRRIGLEATSREGMIDHRSSAMFEPREGGGSRIELRVEPTPRGWRKLLLPLVGLMLRRELSNDFARLKVVLEGDNQAGVDDHADR